MGSPATGLWYACEFDTSGYAVAGRRYLRSLAAVDVPVAWQPLVNTMKGRITTVEAPEGDGVMAELAALPTSPGEAPYTTLLHCIPATWAQLRAELKGERVIGQTVWESDPMPTRWRDELAVVDEVWVPTEWNADVLRRGGVERPVRVVPHAVDHAAPVNPPLSLPADHFVFVSIATWDWRKRPDLLLHAFLRAFTAVDPVTLVLKTNERVLSWWCRTEIERNVWWQVMDVVRQYPDAANVVLVNETWTDEQVAGLWAIADGYVSLTCSEGWGLGAFDAAVAGVPVVITGHGGHIEWIGADHPGLLPFTMEPANHPDRRMFEPGMEWAIADVAAAAAMMRELYEAGGAVAAAASPLSQRLRTEYSHQRIGALMKELLR